MGFFHAKKSFYDIQQRNVDDHSNVILQLVARSMVDGRFFEVGLSQSFLEYGLWQDYGTGRETPRGNSGDLGRAKKRQRRRWFSRKYYASVMNLKEFLEENIGKEFCGIISSALSKDFRQNH